MSGLGITLDAGALIALERGDRVTRALLARAAGSSLTIAVPAGALAQTWRSGARQARLAVLLHDQRCSVVALDEEAAKAAGELCGSRGTSDVIDASVVLCARQRGHVVVTSDPSDLRHLDPGLTVVAVG